MIFKFFNAFVVHNILGRDLSLFEIYYNLLFELRKEINLITFFFALINSLTCFNPLKVLASGNSAIPLS